MIADQSGKTDQPFDFWKRGKHGEVIHVHVKPRFQLFTPVGVSDRPVDLRELEVYRDTFQNGDTGERSFWLGTCAHKRTPFPCTGETWFYRCQKRKCVV